MSETRAKRLTGGGTTEKMLSRLAALMLGSPEKKLKHSVRKAISMEQDVDKICRLATSYGYLLNIQNNVRKTHTLTERMTHLEKMAEDIVLNKYDSRTIKQSV